VVRDGQPTATGPVHVWLRDATLGAWGAAMVEATSGEHAAALSIVAVGTRGNTTLSQRCRTLSQRCRTLARPTGHFSHQCGCIHGRERRSAIGRSPQPL
jgi:hypothetical protein